MKSYKDYQQMMAHLMRQGYNKGGYVRLKNGGEVKKTVSDSFEKILKNKGKVSISDLTKDTGYSKPTVYKYLSENQSSQLVGQPSPFKDKIKKQVDKIVDDVSKSKKPLIDSSPNKIYEKIYGKKFNIKTDNIGVIRNILNENPNWPKIRDAVTNTSTRVGAGNKAFEKVKFKDFKKVFDEAIKQRGIPRAGTVEEFILRDLKRHIDQGGKKFQFAKNNTFDKGFKGLKIKDVKKGDVIDFDVIKKNDPRFKEYKEVFNDIKKLKLTPYIDPITKDQTTLLEGLQKATGVQAPLNIQHNKGVAVDPLKNLSIQTYKANIGAKMVETPEQAQKLGVQTTVKGGKKVVGPKLSFENQVDRLTKFSDRMIKGGGLRTIKTPTETLMRRTSQSSGPTLGANIGLLKGVGETIKAIPTPTGAVALNLAFQPDLSSGIDRAALGAEAAFAPELVRQTSRVSSAPIVQRFFNLGLSPQLAARAARVVSPLGLATLAGEGVYQLGRLGAEQRRRMQEMTPEQRRLFDAEQQSISEFAAAGGGIAKLAGKESGPPPEKGPDSEGLASLLKNVKKR